QFHRPVADVHRRRESLVALADANRAAVSAELAGRGRPGSLAATAYSCRGGRPVPRLLSLQQYDSREAPELLALLLGVQPAQQAPQPGQAHRALEAQRFVPGEIGRASCRERGEVEAGAGTVKDKGGE